MKLKDVKYKNHWSILVFCNQWKMKSDLNKSYGKMSDFVSFLFLGLTLVIKLRNFDFERNTLIFFVKKGYGVRFECFLSKNGWFCFISIVWVHFSRKTEKFRFWKSLKYFQIFELKKWCQIWIPPVKQCLIWFKLGFLRSVL